ncbi:MAG: ROK family protein [Anaerolineales bacterium]|nr:ROK family protein [Anaerolineales bacterium]
MPKQRRDRNRLWVQVAIVVRDQGKTSRAQIARTLNESPSTIGRIVEGLVEKGILLEIGSEPVTSAGRPATILQFNLLLGSVLTIDLRLTKAYVARTDMAGNVLARISRPLTIGDSTAATTELLSLLHEMLDQDGNLPPPCAIIVGAPSVVDPDTGIIEWAPSLGWRNLHLGHIINMEFHLPVHVENDVNLAALGEFWKGAGRGSQNMVFVSVGTGIGSGIILNGNLYRGASNAAGEVAYLVTDIHSLKDSAGHLGTLEMRAGREGIIRLAYLIALRYPASALSDLIKRRGSELRAQDVFTLAFEGDPAAQVVFSETVDLLSIVIGNLSVVLDPEVMVLGGPTEWKWAHLVDAIRDRVGSSLLRTCDLYPSNLGRDAVALGGAYLAPNIEGVLKF